MGVSGAGKTTIGRALAARLGWPFQEGDDLHPPAGIVKMRAGQPLDDRDRLPWLARIAGWIDERRGAGEPGVITCSALKRGYRELLAAGRPEVRFLYLRGSKALIHARLAARRGHFMPTNLLDSQFATLEEPGADELTIRIDVGAPIEQIVETVVRELDAGDGGAGGPGSAATGAPDTLPPNGR